MPSMGIAGVAEAVYMEIPKNKPSILYITVTAMCCTLPVDLIKTKPRKRNTVKPNMHKQRRM